MKSFLFKGTIFALIIAASDTTIGWFLKKGLYDYMGLDRQAAVLCIGHSHTMEDIDDQLLATNLGVPVSKYSLCGVNTFDRLAMLKNYFDEHPHGIRLVVYDVDHLLLNGLPRQSTAYRQLYPFMDNPQMDDYLRNEAIVPGEYYARRILKTLRYTDATRNNALRGYLNKQTKALGIRANLDAIKKDMAKDAKKYKIEIHRESIAALQEAVECVKKYDARLILAFYPTMDIVNSIEPEKYNEVISIFEDLAKKNKNVTFINFNNRYQTEYRYFADSTHMNRDGQLAITKELGNQIAPMLSQH
jgi:hypothetical protein